jgi:eukaryotic-like serine/threonine-protein kinase
MVGTTISHYRILEKIGEGGMGVVYKAQDMKLDRFVALKFLPAHITQSEQEKTRFFQEAKAASALNHPNVCTIYGIDEFNEQQFIEMEFVDGMTLREKINGTDAATVPPLSLKQIVEYGIQIGEGLQEAHRKGIIHRDIKSENIMVNSKNQIKVMDFGLAKLRGSFNVTRPSSTVGTLAYMAPEQIQGVEADVRSDIFSFGVVLFEMTTAKTPFRGEHEAALMYSIVNEEPESALKYRSDVPPELLHILKKSLEKDPEDRYQSMSEIIVDLRRLKKESTRVLRTQEFQRSEQSRSSDSVPLSASTGGRGISEKILIGSGVFLALILSIILVKYVLFPRMASISDQKILVVLPFENLGTAEKDYFVDGMSDEVTSRLSGLSGLKVIARSSAMQYKKTPKTLKQIGAELGANYILQGTVRWENAGGETHVRVNPTLIKVEDETQAWSESMESVLSSAFKLQSDIASRVAGAMNVALLKTEKTSIETSLTDNSEAYDYYLQALNYSERSVAKSDFEIATQLFERAIRLDPKFAAAYAKLSYVHSNMYWFFYDRSPARLEESRIAAEKALDLSPQLSEAHEAKGWYFYHGKLDYVQALNEFSLALKYRPGNSFVYYGIASVMRRQGNMQGAIESYNKAISSNPRAADIIRQLGETQTLARDYESADMNYNKAINLTPDITAIYWEKLKNVVYWKGDYKEARVILDDARRHGKDDDSERLLNMMSFYIEVCEKNYSIAQAVLEHGIFDEMTNGQFGYSTNSLMHGNLELYRGNVQLAKKYYDSARVTLEQKVKEKPDDERFHSALGIAYAGLGRREEAIRSGLRAVELLPIEKEAWRGSFRLLDLARIYTTVGDQEKAIDLLQKLLSIPAEISVQTLKSDPMWNPLHSHPRFKLLVEG